MSATINYSPEELEEMKVLKNAEFDHQSMLAKLVYPFFVPTSSVLAPLKQTPAREAKADFVWLGTLDFHKPLSFLAGLGDFVAVDGIFCITKFIC